MGNSLLEETQENRLYVREVTDTKKKNQFKMNRLSHTERNFFHLLVGHCQYFKEDNYFSSQLSSLAQ